MSKHIIYKGKRYERVDASNDARRIERGSYAFLSYRIEKLINIIKKSQHHEINKLIDSLNAEAEKDLRKYQSIINKYMYMLD